MNASRSARRTVLAATVLVSGAVSALVVLPAAAADPPLRLTTVAVPDRNTDLDLGAHEPSAGDTQVFLDDVQRDGRTVGTSAGSCPRYSGCRKPLTNVAPPGKRSVVSSIAVAVPAYGPAESGGTSARATAVSVAAAPERWSRRCPSPTRTPRWATSGCTRSSTSA